MWTKYNYAPKVLGQAKFPGVGEVLPSGKILSDLSPICGQSHRSSLDFQVGSTPSATNTWQVVAPSGVSFDIWQDIPHGTDTQWFQGVTNGAQVKLNPSTASGSYSYYIANPKNATAGFYVSLTPVDLAPPPPPPPQANWF